MFRLRPLSGVRCDGTDRFTADTGEPWLELLGIEPAGFRGRMVELTYRGSYLDQPTRPLIRFFLDDGSRVDRIAPAPIAGAGVWIGRMPAGTRRIAISPTGRSGCFGFRVESLRRRSWLRLLAEGAGRRPRQTRSALLTKLIGWAPESDSNLAWAIGAFDLPSFSNWSKLRDRPMEADGLDRPRGDDGAPPIVLLMPIGSVAAIADTVASLLQQIHEDWTLLVIGRAGADGQVGGDRRILPLSAAQASAHLAALPSGSLAARLTAGDRLPPYALAFVAEQHRREPMVRLFYGDEVVEGRLALKPGWSPRLMAAHPYLGRAAFVAIGECDDEERCAYVERGALPRRVLDDASNIRALRRILLQRTAAELPEDRDEAMASNVATAARPCPAAAIIIPTCDQPALLQRAVSSIRARSTPGSYRIVVVDNGRDDGPGRDLLASLAGDADAIVLRRTDAFNFSDFCNRAAAACDEPLLVFLNDDTEVLSDDWLSRLGRLATQGDVGAVGARLTYPDGRLQHVGVLVGMGGSAGHPEALAAGDDPGWLGRNSVPHEMSAVTGACLAVARDKFLAVGGFDAEALPVELSDIDLCLKLNARGWQTLVDPQVHLMHEESASRGGATFRRLTKYSRQRDIFIERWRHVLRDDPCFHPGLSLYSLAVALG